MVFDTAIMRCDICWKQRPEPMLTLRIKEWTTEKKEHLLVEVRYCTDSPTCTTEAAKRLKE